MKRLALATAATLLFVLGLCGCSSTPAGTQLEKFSFGERTRSYLIHVPEGLDAAESAPLVLVLHGFAETAAAAVRSTDFLSLADRDGFIVAFPNAVRRTWQYNDVNSGPAYLRGVDDVAFLTAVVDRLKGQYTIDPQRIYAAGFSNGGFMVQKLACERANLFAGIAAVSASLTDQLAACTPANPIPVVLIAGTEDPIIPWNGGTVNMGPLRQATFLSIEATAQKWAAANGCDAEPTVTELPDTGPNDGTRIARRDYGACTGTASVVLYAIQGGGHAWPSSPAPYPNWIVGRTSKDIDGPETVWDFFKAHPRPSR